MKIEDMAFGTFFPLRDVVQDRFHNQNKLFQAIYALSKEEVDFQNLMLAKVLDTICIHMLPSLLPTCSDSPYISFTHFEDPDVHRFREDQDSVLQATLKFNCCRDPRSEVHNNLFQANAVAGYQFKDVKRNVLAIKYVLLHNIFQPNMKAANSSKAANHACIILPSWSAVKKAHMGTAAVNSISIYINRQDTIEDIITSFFVDGIPFDGFPEEA